MGFAGSCFLCGADGSSAWRRLCAKRCVLLVARVDVRQELHLGSGDAARRALRGLGHGGRHVAHHRSEAGRRPDPGIGGLAVARTAGFTMLVLAQLFKCLNSRSERESAFRGIFGNPLRWVAIVVSLAPQVLVVHVPLFNDAFTATPLSAGEWALCAGMASSVLWIDELKKLIVRRRHGRADE